MNRQRVQNVRVTVKWKSGAKTRVTIPTEQLTASIAIYIQHGPMAAIRKITVKEAS